MVLNGFPADHFWVLRALLSFFACEQVAGPAGGGDRNGDVVSSPGTPEDIAAHHAFRMMHVLESQIYLYRKLLEETRNALITSVDQTANSSFYLYLTSASQVQVKFRGNIPCDPRSIEHHLQAVSVT